VHCEFCASLHVSCNEQWSISVHAWHLSFTSSTRKKPWLHDPHCVSPVVEHSSGDEQFGTGVQSRQTDIGPVLST